MSTWPKPRRWFDHQWELPCPHIDHDDNYKGDDVTPQFIYISIHDAFLSNIIIERLFYRSFKIDSRSTKKHN
jgi:hypothetical protein